MAENFTKYLVDYFKNKLSSGKDIKCKNCKKNKKFISQVNDNGSIELKDLPSPTLHTFKTFDGLDIPFFFIKPKNCTSNIL